MSSTPVWLGIGNFEKPRGRVLLAGYFRKCEGQGWLADMLRMMTLLCVLLAGCASENGAICEVPKSNDWSNPGPCVHRRAYQLAGAPGSSSEVSKAVVAACEAEIESFAQANAKGDDAKSKREAHDEIVDSVRDVLERDALFRVTQARAGNCQPIGN
ncbi:hypothetical protein [Stakelama tenebrarum]|uniref:Uncharacterized protein n=1 Tax=Stakelama tenebrarum TaxID=2711215 RepID=A0A6G6Y5J2_9SPHN|nr:hypothetical protein [Sphingosinithalassobacter tenebrarum]QIG80202.1 hypothetical protein G5C33_10695 [Sphingosinithalassobacter tenebrarum]